jgi:YD repeat-containing protein
LNYATNGTGAPATNRISTVQEGPGAYPISYDNAGNLTADNSAGATYTYDGASRLKTASTATSSYEYDGDGWRVKQVAGGVSTFYPWSSVFGQPVLELNGSGGVERAYVFSSAGQRVALQKGVSFYWVHTDHLGSSHKLTDTSGNVAYTAEYDPHGNLRFESGTATLTTRKFTGYERDAAQLDYAQARTYSYRLSGNVEGPLNYAEEEAWAGPGSAPAQWLPKQLTEIGRLHSGPERFEAGMLWVDLFQNAQTGACQFAFALFERQFNLGQAQGRHLADVQLPPLQQVGEQGLRLV